MKELNFNRELFNQQDCLYEVTVPIHPHNITVIGIRTNSIHATLICPQEECFLNATAVFMNVSAILLTPLPSLATDLNVFMCCAQTQRIGHFCTSA